MVVPGEYQLAGSKGQNQIGSHPSAFLIAPRSQRTTLK
jgi:hypothetical protein